MKFSKIVAFVLAALVISSSLSVATMASATTLTENEVSSSALSVLNASTRSHDSSFDLDFSQSTVWTLDFDNNSTLMFNHKKVTVGYLSNSPSNANATVRVELYIDEDKDGTYEKYDPDGGYLFTLKKGESVAITLPYGNTVKNYRLVFENRTASVTSGTFSVKTS